MAELSDWIYVGSGSDCAVRIPQSGVAAHHARCRMEESGRVLVQDLDSPGGTAINQPGNRFTLKYLDISDTLYLNGRPVLAAAIYQALSGLRAQVSAQPITSAAGAADPSIRHLQPGKGVTVIGRDPDPANKQRIIFPGPMVSKNHAGILRTDADEYYLWDLGSTYGTFVASRRVGSRRTRVAPHEVIEIAGLRFMLGTQPAAAPGTREERGAILADGVSAEVRQFWNRRLVLDGVRLYIPPRSLVALMGASGAGKTTLLSVLAGQSKPVSGRVFYDNLDLFSSFSRIRASLGYVPQDDILHPQLTVKQALFFSARLRLPADYSSEEIRKRVDGIIARLGIAGQADTAIGSPIRRGISGGQRKRTNLATELVPDPRVLLLDEPTSGLSSADAERVVRTLRELAREGRTVIVTIHQPSRQVFEMFDYLAVLDNDAVRIIPAPPPQAGRLIFSGPARLAPSYFQEHDASGNSRSFSGAEAVFVALESNPDRKTAEWEQRFRDSKHFPVLSEHLAKAVPADPPPKQAEKRRSLPSPWHQLSALLSRLWSIKRSDWWALCQSVALQPLLVGLGITLAAGTLSTNRTYSDAGYIRDFLPLGKALFFAVFTAMWFGCNNTAREIVAEASVYRRERFAGLSLGAYLSSKVVFFAGIGAVQCLILAAAVSIGSGLRAGIPFLAFLLWLAALCGSAIGLLISSLSSEGERAIQLVPLALLPMILFGGGLTRLADFQSPLARRLSFVVPARWAFEAVLLAENDARPVTVDFNAPGAQSGYTPQPIPDRFSIVHHFFQASPHSENRLPMCAACMLAFMIIFVGLAGLSLRMRDLH